MKRKRAMAFNAKGYTREYIGQTQLNRINNGMYMDPVSNYNGVNVIFGEDYSYTQYGGVPSRAFRKQFNLGDFGFISRFNLWDEIIPLGKLDTSVYRYSRYVYWYLGWRIVIEYFDTNALVDFVNNLDGDVERAEAMESFVKRFSAHYSVSILTENIINVSERK